jgi:hypothetical protein
LKSQDNREWLRALPLKAMECAKADIIRQLITQAKPEDFPKSWQMRAAERRAQQPRR